LTNLHEILWRGWMWVKEELVRFSVMWILQWILVCPGFCAIRWLYV